MPTIKTILTTAVIVLLVVWATAKIDEKRSASNKKLIFNPNI